MSTKSSQTGAPKQIFSGKMIMMAIIMLIVFGTIIVAYPRIFSPSNIGSSTAPVAPGAAVSH